MAGRTDWLYKLYRSHEQPCFCFGPDLKILWINAAAMKDFPHVAEENELAECFPQFSFTGLFSEDKPTSSSLQIYNKLDGQDRLEVLTFPDPKEGSLYVGIYYGSCPFHLASSGNEQGSVKLLSYYIRQRMTSIFNLSELISERLVEREDYESAYHIRDIERNCRSLLKLSYNFNAYYTVSDENAIYQTEVDFHEYFTPLMNQVEMILAATGLSFVFDPDYQNGIVKLDKVLFATALLNVVNISYLYAQEEGHFICRTEFFPDEMLLTMEDNVTDYEAVTTPGILDVVALDATGEPPAMKKMCYDILQKTVELHGGQCIIADNHPGVKILIRMKAKLIDNDFVSDEPVYTSRRRVGGKLGIVDIMLSDVTY